MRLKFGRPDLAQYADRFDVPAADSDFAVAFLGVSTLLIDDGESAVMTDGYFSRPSLFTVGLGRVVPDHARINAALARTSVTRLEGVLPVHTHFDHALDSAVVAEKTGALIQGSAGYVPGAPTGHRADVAYLGVGQLGLQDEDYIRAYWAETVQTVGAKSVLLIHWDDFFRPLDEPLRALPYAGDDLGVTMRVLGRLAADQAVELHFPTVWQPEDPWASLR